MPEQFSKTLDPTSGNQFAKTSDRDFNSKVHRPDGSEQDLVLNIVSMDFDGSFNIPPTSKAVIVYMNKDNHYVFELLSFGLVASYEKPTDPAAVKRGSKNGPAYSKEIQHGQLRHFNCRKETIANNKLLWVDSRKNLRCVVPIQGYFEWQKTKEKPVYYVTLKDRPLVFLAGLYSHNYNYNDTEIVKDGDEYLSSFSIVTGPGEGKGSNDLSWLHGRKPILLEPNTKEWDAWLTPNHQWDPKLLDTSLNHETNIAYDTITSYEVDKAIGNPLVDGPDNLKPVKKQQRGIGLFFKREPQEEKPPVKAETSVGENPVKAETSVKEEPKAKEEAKDADGGDDVDEEELKEIEDDDLPDDGVEDVDDVEDDGAYDEAEAGGEGGDDGEDDDDDDDDDDAASVQEEVEEIESDEEDEDNDEEPGNVEVVEDEEDVGEKEVGGDDVEDEDVKAEKEELGEEQEVEEDEEKPATDEKADKKAKTDKGKKAAEEPLAGSKRKSSAKGSESKRKR